MSNLSEEKIIEYAEYMIKHLDFNKIGYVYGTEVIQGLLDLYNKEKKENERYWQRNREYEKTLERLQKDTIWKDKLREILEDIDNSRPIIAENKLRKLLEEK